MCVKLWSFSLDPRNLRSSLGVVARIASLLLPGIKKKQDSIAKNHPTTKKESVLLKTHLVQFFCKPFEKQNQHFYQSTGW